MEVQQVPKNHPELTFLTPPVAQAPEDPQFSPSSPLCGETLDAVDDEDDDDILLSDFAARCSNKPSLAGPGLANLGNTCFLNSILQCFTHTVPLVEGLRSCVHQCPCDRGNEEFCVLCALREHIELSLASPQGFISPVMLVDNMKYISSSFQRYQQEDAHEFLQCFLDKLDSCFSGAELSKDDNLVRKIFGGSLISKLRCCDCHHCSDSYESIVDLSLDIKDVDTLQCALKSFTTVEKIGGSEMKFTCENCKEEVSVEKQFLLDLAPSVAAFHLKRFRSNGTHIEKIDKYVKYPLELDLNPYINGSQNDNVELKYELYAAVVHVGHSPNSGHYFCFVRSSPDSWHRLDDTKVTQVQEDFVLAQEAYILFYARQGTPWFSSLVENQKSWAASNNLNTSPKSVLDDLDIPSVSRSVADICSPLGSRVRDLADQSPAMSSKQTYLGIVNRSVQADSQMNNATCINNAPLQCEAGASGFEEFHNAKKRHESSLAGKARGPTEQTPAMSSKLINDEHSRSSVEADSHIKNASIQGVAGSLGKGTLDSATSLSDSSQVGETNINRSDVSVCSTKNEPHTPPRSPSLDLYAEETNEDCFQIPRLLVKQRSCERVPNKALEDSKRREAFRAVQGMPGIRRKKLMDALVKSYSEDSGKRKNKRRMDSSPCETPIHHPRRKSCPNPFMQPGVLESLVENA